MTIRLFANGEIQLDGQATGLHLSQGKYGTEVYTPERGSRPYQRHDMPARRYNCTTDLVKPGTVGISQLEADVRALLARLQKSGA